ncbi:4'-phosphopantetheinyl transferase family protein, partial [Streptomyces sp. NPDC057927]
MFNADLINRGFPEVHIWLVDLEREFKYSNEIFSIEERNRADKFHNEESKNIFLTCRFALRKLLGIYLNIEPSKLSFSFNCYGKPDLSSIQNTLGLA